jgi:hypothetical protein
MVFRNGADGVQMPLKDEKRLPLTGATGGGNGCASGLNTPESGKIVEAASADGSNALESFGMIWTI